MLNNRINNSIQNNISRPYNYILVRATVVQFVLTIIIWIFSENLMSTILLSLSVCLVPILAILKPPCKMSSLWVPVVPFMFMHLLDFPLKALATQWIPWSLLRPQMYSEKVFNDVLAYLALALSLFMLGYTIVSLCVSNYPSRLLNRSNSFIPYRTYFLVFAGIGLLGLVISVVRSGGALYAFVSPASYGGKKLLFTATDSTLSQIIQLLILNGFFAITSYIYLLKKKIHLNNIDKIIFILSMLMMTISILISGTKSGFMWLIPSVIIPITLAKKIQLKYKHLILGFVFFCFALFFVFSETISYRNYVKTNIITIKSPGETIINNTKGVLISIINTIIEPNFDETITNISLRFCGIDNVAHILIIFEGKPQNMQRLFMLPVMPFIPRAIWPDKPISFGAGDLSLAQGGVREDRQGWKGGASFFFLGCLIHDGGLPGALLVYFLLGAFVSFIYNILILKIKNEIIILSLIMVMVAKSLAIQGDYYNMFNDVFRYILFLFIIKFLIEIFTSRYNDKYFSKHLRKT